MSRLRHTSANSGLVTWRPLCITGPPLMAMPTDAAHSYLTTPPRPVDQEVSTEEIARWCSAVVRKTRSALKRKTRGLVGMVSVCLLGVFVLLGYFVGLGLHRLAEAVTLTVHLKDLAPMGQPVQQRRRHPISLEHTPPLAKRQVARHQHTPPLVAIREHLEQQLRAVAAER